MLAILDLSMGNIHSIANAICECGLDEPTIIDGSTNLDDITHLILPGVGHFNAASEILHQRNLIQKLHNYATSGRPLLGICLGMQLLAEHGTEGGNSDGLGFISGTVKKIASTTSIRLPHVGWNNVNFKIEHPVLKNIKKDRDFYFTHSYAVDCTTQSHIIAETEYGQIFPSIIGTKNVIGFQFHPEKSQINGLTMLENFCHWDGKC